MTNKMPIDDVALPADIKVLNRFKILDLFTTGDRLTAFDIHQATGISKPTIMRALQFFCESGTIASVGLGSSSKAGGKRPEYFAFADNRKILCIALWPESITFALSGLVTDVYEIRTYPRKPHGSLEETFAVLAEKAMEYLDDNQLSIEDLYGIGLSTAGTVNYAQNILHYNSQDPDWGTDIPMEQYLQPIFGKEKVYVVENAGKVCGRAILTEQPELADRRVISIFSTWGISACLIENGHVLSGKDSLIGEIGHMTIDTSDTRVCGCGKRGCLENKVNRFAVGDLLANCAEWKDRDISFTELFNASREGDATAREIVRMTAHYFAVVLHNLSLAYNPNIVIFQGDYALADVYFDTCLKKELAEFRYASSEDLLEIIYDHRPLHRLAAKGEAAMVKQHYFSTKEYM